MRKMVAPAPQDRPSTWQILEQLLSSLSSEQRLKEQSVLLQTMQRTIAWQREELTQQHQMTQCQDSEERMRYAQPPVGVSMLFTGAWTPTHHQQCFWGFRAQVVATLIAIFGNGHHDNIFTKKGRHANSSELHLWQIITLHITGALWDRSLMWILGPVPMEAIS